MTFSFCFLLFFARFSCLDFTKRKFFSNVFISFSVFVCFLNICFSVWLFLFDYKNKRKINFMNNRGKRKTEGNKPTKLHRQFDLNWIESNQLDWVPKSLCDLSLYLRQSITDSQMSYTLIVLLFIIMRRMEQSNSSGLRAIAFRFCLTNNTQAEHTSTKGYYFPLQEFIVLNKLHNI